MTGDGETDGEGRHCSLAIPMLLLLGSQSHPVRRATGETATASPPAAGSRPPMRAPVVGPRPLHGRLAADVQSHRLRLHRFWTGHSNANDMPQPFRSENQAPRAIRT
jgi:hypothetical protein